MFKESVDQMIHVCCWLFVSSLVQLVDFLIDVQFSMQIEKNHSLYFHSIEFKKEKRQSVKIVSHTWQANDAECIF